MESVQFPLPQHGPSYSAPSLEESGRRLWQDLDNFYAENEGTISRCLQLDVESAAGNEKIMEASLAIDNFVSTADVILEGLVALGNVHPILGVAIFAFHSVIRLDLARRDNNKKVLAVKLQMQNMMCAMFQLRHLKHAHAAENERAEQRALLQRLVKAIADDITKCGSDLTYYMDRRFISKFIKANVYERRFLNHIQVFTQRRSELQTVISAYAAAGIDAVNIMLINVNDKVDVMGAKLDSIATALFRKLDTPREQEVHKFIEQSGGAKACIEQDDLLKELMSKSGEGLPDDKRQGSAARQGGPIPALRQELKAELKQDLDEVLAKNLIRFEKLLNVQNNNLERMSDRIEEHGYVMKDHSMKLDKLVNASILILEEGKVIKKAVLPNATTKLKDPGIKSSVKAKIFVSTLRDYLLIDSSLPPTPYTALPPENPQRSNSLLLSTTTSVQAQPSVTSEEDPDSWVFDFIDVGHIQPIVEAMDEDNSGFISVKEANKFALTRPKGWTLLQWIAYWAAGYHISLVNYKQKIYATMREMHEASKTAHPANRAYVNHYLNYEDFRAVEGILRAIKPLPQDSYKEPKLTDLVDAMKDIQEQRLSKNLTEISYVIEAISDATLVAGSGRAEIWILPILHLVLRHHLLIIKNAQKRVIQTEEMATHSTTLTQILTVFRTRMRTLEVVFKQVHRDVDAQFQRHAYGMFYEEFKDTSCLPSRSTLLIATEYPDSYTSPDAPDDDNLALYKGPGPNFIFTELDLKPVDSGVPSSQTPHSIEGEWTGVCVLDEDHQTAYQGCFSIVIGPVVDGKFTGKGETYMGSINLVGELQTPDCAETTSTLIDLTFQIKSAEYADFKCKGILCTETRTIKGDWRVYEPEYEPPQNDDSSSHDGSIAKETTNIDDHSDNGSADGDGLLQDPVDAPHEHDLETQDSPNELGLEIRRDEMQTRTSNSEIQTQNEPGLETQTENITSEVDSPNEPDLETETGTAELAINDTVSANNLEKASDSEERTGGVEADSNGSDDGLVEDQEGSPTVDEDENSGGKENNDFSQLKADKTDDDGLSVSDASDDSESEPGGIKGYFYMTSNSPNIVRFRPLIDNPLHEPSLNAARKRWAYAIEVVLFDYRQRKGSSSFFKARLEERRRWIEYTIRSLLEVYTDSTRGFLTPDMKKHLTLYQWQTHPSNARLYQAMAKYLHNRLIHWRNHLDCDVCDQLVVFVRYICIACIREDYTNQVDLCTECIDSRIFTKERTFVHHLSHSLLRTTSYIFYNQFPILIPQARGKSERIKRSFKVIESQQNETDRASKMYKGIEHKLAKGSEAEDVVTSRPTLTELVCAGCNKELTLPCWVCVTCARDTLICIDCELAQKRIESYWYSDAHSITHPLLRISDSAEVKTSELKESRLDRQLEEMEHRINTSVNEGVSLLELKLNTQVEAMKMEMKSAFESRLEERLNALEAKVDSQFGTLVTMLERVLSLSGAEKSSKS